MKKFLTLALAFAAVATAQATQKFGAFTYYPKIDPLTDQNRSKIITDGNEDYDASLVWICANGRLNVYFEPDDYIGSDDTFTVVYRFDKQPMSAPREWDASTDGEAAFLPENLVPSFTKAAKNAKSIVLRTYDFNGTSITQSFNLNGLAAALAKLPCAKGI